MRSPDIVSIVDEGLGNSSYVVDLGNGNAMVVDPVRDPAPYLAAAEKQGLRIALAAETHLHADFVSGSSELAALGAQVVAARAAGLERPHHGLDDGETLDIGGLVLEALATPGHTPEHLAYLLRENGRPVALFSGGSLLVGAVARTDLVAPDRTEALARELWRSIHDQLLVLPDELAVYPTHGAGSFCSIEPGGDRVTTIGRERGSNPLLAAPDEDTFVARLVAGFGTYPPYFRELREVNRRGPGVLGRPLPLPALEVETVRSLADEGAVVIDVRPVPSFAAGHIPGALSIPLRPQFATWLGWLVRRDRSLVFVVAANQDRSELVRQCTGIGYDGVVGELAGGMEAWAGRGLPMATVPLVAAGEVSGTLVDVRQRGEFESGHVPGSLHLELGELAQRAPSLPAGALTVMCGHGERAMGAASILSASGRNDVSVLVGGPAEVAVARQERLAT